MKKLIRKIYQSVKYNDIYNYSEANKLVSNILAENHQMLPDLKFYFSERQKRNERGKGILVNNITMMIAIIGLFISSIINISEIASATKLFVTYVFTLFFLGAVILELLTNLYNRLVQG